MYFSLQNLTIGCKQKFPSYCYFSPLNFFFHNSPLLLHLLLSLSIIYINPTPILLWIIVHFTTRFEYTWMSLFILVAYFLKKKNSDKKWLILRYQKFIWCSLKIIYKRGQVLPHRVSCNKKKKPFILDPEKKKKKNQALKSLSIDTLWNLLPVHHIFFFFFAFFTFQ